MSYAAYAGVQKATESSLDLEIRAISHVTQQLIQANKPGIEPLSRIRALNGNIRLWGLLIEYLSDPANALPDQIKASYVSLGIYARKTSLAALNKTSELTSLIRINADLLDALDYQRKGSIAA